LLALRIHLVCGLAGMEMPEDLSAMIQDMVRRRIRQNWPCVRAHECRRKRQAAVLAVGEWVLVVRSSSEGDNWIGRVLQIGVLPHNARQQDYFKPASALPFILDWYRQVPDTCHYVKWSASAAPTDNLVPPRRLLAVGFKMNAVPSLPLEWPLRMRRPGGKRRIGSAYVMPKETVSQLAGVL